MSANIVGPIDNSPNQTATIMPQAICELFMSKQRSAMAAMLSSA